MPTFKIHNFGSVLACQTPDILVPLYIYVACLKFVRCSKLSITNSEQRLLILKVTATQKEVSLLRKLPNKVQSYQINKRCKKQKQDKDKSGKVYFGNNGQKSGNYRNKNHVIVDNIFFEVESLDHRLKCDWFHIQKIFQ